MFYDDCVWLCSCVFKYKWVCVVDCGLLYDAVCFVLLGCVCVCALLIQMRSCVLFVMFCMMMCVWLVCFLLVYDCVCACAFNTSLCCLRCSARVGVRVLFVFVVGGVCALSVWCVYTCVCCWSFIV